MEMDASNRRRLQHRPGTESLAGAAGRYAPTVAGVSTDGPGPSVVLHVLTAAG